MDIYVYEFLYFTYNFYVTRYIFEKEGARGVPPLMFSKISPRWPKTQPLQAPVGSKEYATIHRDGGC